jgi:threonine synthase
MQLRSTKSKSPLVSYREAVLDCLPEDGGLYVPDQAVDFRQFFTHMNEKTSFQELVAAAATSFLDDSLNPVSASRVAKRAFDFEPKLIKLDDEFSLLNLYSGHTGVFKDFGIAFLSAILEEFLEKDSQIMILSAAMPDTGVSMSRAFSGKKGILLVLLYPSGQIHGLDPSTYVPNGGNIIPVQVKGTFDDCQRLIIETINDREFSKHYNITSCNSMNSNNSIGDYIHDKPFACTPLVHTNFQALDVSFHLNHERLASFYDESSTVMRNMVYPASIDNDLTLKTMEFVYKKYNIFIDPHTVVAFAEAQKIHSMNEWNSNTHTIVLATGHPEISANIVEEATGGKKVAHFISALQKKCDPVAVIFPQLDAFENVVAGCF